MTKKIFLILTLLLTTVVGVWAWDGSGTSTDPYLIKSSADWKQLADDVNGGNSYSGKYFEMTADIDAEGISVGSDPKPFSGIFSGGMHTLTYDRGGAKPDRFEYVEDICAPFIKLNGATIRHLKVKGSIFSRHTHCAGLASLIEGSQTTTIDDCHVSVRLFADSNLESDASFGGLVGSVTPIQTATPVIKNSSFTGGFSGWATRSSGMVGYTNWPIAFEHCMVDLKETSFYPECATFARTAPNVTCTFKECYYTQLMGAEQGVAVFREVLVSDGCKAEIVSEPTIDFDGVKYWQNGALVKLTAPDDVAFNHWETNGTCYLSNPWLRNGTFVISDLSRKPIFSPLNEMVKPSDEREMDGIKYRYLSRRDYHLYLSDEVCRQKGYQFDKNDNLFKWDAAGNKVWVTAIVGWVPGDIPSGGAVIYSDLKVVGRDHTLTACIAPMAFQGCTELKTLYFKDTGANTTNASFPFDFTIGDYAFAYCGNLTEVKMMQYTTKGDNHWEALTPDQVREIGDSVFSHSPQAQFSVDASQYQKYMSSTTWKDYQRRIIIYNHTFSKYAFDVNGASYNCMYNTAGDPIKNNDAGHDALMQQIRFWNADYQQFTASSLLSNSDKNIWYAQVLGADDSYLRKNGGVMRVYNDPGSQYNYKTIAIKSLGGSKEVKHIEFYQTNGLSDNSYSDLKLVIQNNAFKGCTNLKELRMFYYVEDGEDHWETLGPEDVIPGDNIFGEPSAEEAKSMGREELRKRLKDIKSEDFKILVSPDRYQEFLNDPNWLAYRQYIEPVDFNPNNTDTKDFSLGGLTYGYMTSPGGIMQTSQTVSQDVSWWTAPRIAFEVIMDIITVGQLYSTWNAVSTAMTQSAQLAVEAEAIGAINEVTTGFVGEGAARRFVTLGETVDMLMKTSAPGYAQHILQNQTQNQFIQRLISIGLISEEGVFASPENVVKLVMSYGVDQAEDAFYKAGITYYAGLCSDFIRNQSIPYVMKKGMKSVPWRIFSLGRKGAMEAASPGSFLSQFANTSACLSTNCWGGTGSYNGDALRKGMRENIASNIHQWGLVGGGYVITTPQKNLCYHTYIKAVPDTTTQAMIYAGTGKGQGRNNNARTVTMAKKAFRNHTSLKTISFHETGVQSDEAMPMLFVIPDSAFVGCINLQRFDLRVRTEKNGQQALGPESFILGGDSIFAGLDPAKFHIIIDSSRKQDFLDNDSWKPLEQYFVYEDAQPKTQYQEYGGNYAYAYENGSTQKVHKESGHKIDHTVVTGADNGFLAEHQGALKLCNDIGVWNNFQLDAVTKKAFKGNQNLRVVNFTDLKGTGAYGDCYTGLQVALMDSCFADCKNLVNLDLLYLVTDGDNHIDPIKPNQVTIGQGVLAGTTAKIKMMPQQVAWFEADTTWNQYKDRFLPCIIKPGDDGIKKALKPMAYYDMASTGYDPTTWDDYIDLARIGGAGFSWLDDKFQDQKENIRSFAEFKHFESVGLDYVGKEWFRGCKNLSNIVLPSTIKTIREFAFANCYKLEEIDLPAALTEIGDEAFNDCPVLKTIRVLGTTPAKLTGKAQFSYNDGLKIIVPAASVEAYKTAWAEYKDYIVSDATNKINKVVTVSKPDELAEKLGLFVEMSYSGLGYGDEPRYVHGPYAKYDSLTISGPLGNIDLAVIRYLAGCDAYAFGGKDTDGCLRYLNLYNADIKKTKDGRHYYNDEQIFNGARYDIKDDNKLPPYLFADCTALETVVLPKSLTYMDARIFKGCSALKRVAITASLKDYDNSYYLSGLLDYPLEELVFVADKPAVSEHSNPWKQPILAVFTKTSQLSDYLNQPYLTCVAQSISAPFADDAVMETLAQKGQFFPSEYTSAESAENLFNDNQTIKTFDEFRLFSNVKSLNRTFANASALKRISLPDSLMSIGAEAFSGCSKLDTISIASEKVPTLAQHAFASLPKDFRILVPKNLCKLYREQWAEYADHINVDDQNYHADSEWTVVTLEKPNTLAEKLGFKVTWDYKKIILFGDKHNYINGVRGDYSKIHKLKVKGPISGSDFAIMRYLAGFCPWTNSRNVMGRLEAIDLYDADIKKGDHLSAPDMFYVIKHMGPSHVEKDNELPIYAFLQAYSLKSLVLPKTCTKINTRALQQSEALETLVLGDDLVDFDWSALDDDVMLTRLYIMAKKKPAMTQDSWLVRQLYNNYNPTFDAFYVRPSLLQEYLSDRTYTVDLKRTNLISAGVFDEDDSFCAFASHGAANADDLGTVMSVDGWFDNYPGAKNLTPLQYTGVDSLSKATLAPLTQLQQIAMPSTLEAMQEGLFSNAKHLRYVDFLQCDSTNIVSKLRNGGLAKLGINTQQTLAYVPGTYGNTDETNVVMDASSGSAAGTLRTKTYRMVDSLGYLVPYAFEAEKIENARTLAASAVPYTVCVPYKMKVPEYSRAYKLSERNGSSLVFTEVTSELEAMHPYLLKVVGNKRFQKMSTTLNTDIAQTIPASGGNTYGRQDDALGYSLRGTFDAISNKDAANLGAYILQSDGDWHPVSTASQKASILPFRAFLLPSARNARARISMTLDDDETTAIDSIETIDADGTRRYYDLNGRELQGKPDKGVYIYKGKKYVNK